MWQLGFAVGAWMVLLIRVKDFLVRWVVDTHQEFNYGVRLAVFKAGSCSPDEGCGCLEEGYLQYLCNDPVYVILMTTYFAVVVIILIAELIRSLRPEEATPVPELSPSNK